MIQGAEIPVTVALNGRPRAPVPTCLQSDPGWLPGHVTIATACNCNPLGGVRDFTLRAACPECGRLLILATVPAAQAAGEISTFGMHGADSPRL